MPLTSRFHNVGGVRGEEAHLELVRHHVAQPLVVHRTHEYVHLRQPITADHSWYPHRPVRYCLGLEARGTPGSRYFNCMQARGTPGSRSMLLVAVGRKGKYHHYSQAAAFREILEKAHGDLVKLASSELHPASTVGWRARCDPPALTCGLVCRASECVR